MQSLRLILLAAFSSCYASNVGEIADRVSGAPPAAIQQTETLIAGGILERATVIDGFKNGPYELVLLTGEVIERGSYHNGVRTGLCTKYSSAGARLEEGVIKGGKRSGPWITWRDDGSIQSVAVLEPGVMFSGPYVYWDRDGNPTIRYADDREILFEQMLPVD